MHLYVEVVLMQTTAPPCCCSLVHLNELVTVSTKMSPPKTSRGFEAVRHEETRKSEYQE